MFESHFVFSQLMDFLRAQGETCGYTNYWVEYPLAFASQDELIFTARLPYHADSSDLVLLLCLQSSKTGGLSWRCNSHHDLG